MTTFTRRSFPKPPVKALATNPVTDAYAKAAVGGAPVAFSAQTGLAPNKSAVLNAQTLQSGFRTPYFVDEIRISLSTNTYERSPLDPVQLTGLTNAVSVLFQTGDKMFSSDYVPVGLLGPVFSPMDYGEVEVGSGEQAAFQAYATVRWALPKPLYMPAGDVVLANVALNDPDGVFTTIFGADTPCVNVTVTYVGRLIPAGFVSPTRHVPWVAWFRKRASEKWASSQTRFRNPFLVSAHVQRFISRTYFTQFNQNDPTEEYLVELWQEGQLPSTTVPFQEVLVSDSRGYSIVSKYAPIGEVFDSTRKVWTFGRELTSREQFNMEVRNGSVDPGIPPPMPTTNTDYITNIGLIGYREEAL